jgi:hypothetical protein
MKEQEYPHRDQRDTDEEESGSHESAEQQRGQTGNDASRNKERAGDCLLAWGHVGFVLANAVVAPELLIGSSPGVGFVQGDAVAANPVTAREPNCDDQEE